MKARELRFAFVTDDYEAAVRLFRDVIGLEVREEFDEQGGRGILLSLPAATLELVDPEHGAMVDQVEVGHRVDEPVRIAVRVDDLVEASTLVAGAEAEPMAGPVETPWGDRNRRFRARDGMQITLFQPPEPHRSATDDDRRVTATEIIDENLYLVLGTADEAGRPWASPVYYAMDGSRDFYWVSSPQATHSRNISVRPQVGMVIFNSRAPIGTGQGVYMSAVAEQVKEGDLQHGIEVFSRRSLRHGGRPWTVEDVTGEEAPIRLYRATASEQSVLAKDGLPDHRIPVDLGA